MTGRCNRKRTLMKSIHRWSRYALPSVSVRLRSVTPNISWRGITARFRPLRYVSYSRRLTWRQVWDKVLHRDVGRPRQRTGHSRVNKYGYPLDPSIGTVIMTRGWSYRNTC